MKSTAIPAWSVRSDSVLPEDALALLFSVILYAPIARRAAGRVAGVLSPLLRQIRFGKKRSCHAECDEVLVVLQGDFHDGDIPVAPGQDERNVDLLCNVSRVAREIGLV